MAGPANLVLQLLITAKDNASEAVGKIFGFLDRTTSATANLIREKFTDLFGGGMKGAIEFEAQLDRVAAKGGYTADNMAELKSAAQSLGAQFGISGTEAAKGFESLAAAGLSAKDAIATLPSVLALASSEQISADAAAQKLIDSLSIMGLGFEEAGRMADVLAKGANITTSSASQLAEALSEAGGVARAAGLDLEVTVAALDLLHKNGIKGSEAGTALKSILTALLDPASKASTELDALGITSRDLGTVLGELQGYGDAASGAILAFGTEAGPGLRALIGEGQAGLNDYTAQLRDANGAAQQASDEMGGNLKAALDTLSSSWDSLKSALIEPFLEPVTAKVKELAAAFQEGLSSEKFKAVQDTLKDFGRNAAEAIGDFIQSFDFKGALNSLADFVIEAGSHFDSIAKWSSIAADTIKIAWNAVTISFKSVTLVFAAAIAGVETAFEGVVKILNSLGLVSDDTTLKIQDFADKARDYVAELSKSIEQDAEDIKKGYDGIIDKAKETKGAIKAVADQAAVPPNAQVLEPIKKSLEDYTGILNRAKIAQAEAAKAASDAETDYLLIGAAFDNGTTSALHFEVVQKTLKATQDVLKVSNSDLEQATSDYNAEVQRLIRETDMLSTVEKDANKEKQEQLKNLEQSIDRAGSYAKALEGTANAQLAAKDAEINLAKAKGDTAEVQKLTIERTKLETDWAIRIAQAKQAEQEAEYALAVAIRNQVEARVEMGEARKEDLVLAELQVQKELAEAQAAGINTQAQLALAEALKKVNEQSEFLTDQAGALTEAVQTETDTIQESSGVIDEWKKNLDLFGSSAEDLNSRLEEMNQRAEDSTREHAENMEGQASWAASIINSLIQRLGSLSSAAEEAFRVQSLNADAMRKSIASATDATSLLQIAMHNLGTGGSVDWANRLAIDALQIEMAFKGQAVAAEQLTEQLKKISEEGGVTSAAMQVMANQVKTAQQTFNLLDQERLDNLQDALDKANDKIREMKEATQSAKDRLTELNAELLEAQGADQKAELLRQQLDYQQQLAEIERQRMEAEAINNDELIVTLQEQKAILEQIYQTKVANIEAEVAAESAAQKTADATTRLASNADSIERIGKAMSGMANTDLSRIVNQSEQLTGNLTALNEAL